MKNTSSSCCVCSDDRGWDENPLVFCDGSTCKIAVHQACYGIENVPTGTWLCSKCDKPDKHNDNQKCALCPFTEGAFKRSDNGGWAHVVCALYIPEVRFGNVSTMEPIIISHIPKESFERTCYLCDRDGRDGVKILQGACMQCNKTGCKHTFHVTCALAEGLLCEEAGANGNVKYCGYCSYHISKAVSSKGVDIKVISPFPSAVKSPRNIPINTSLKNFRNSNSDDVGVVNGVLVQPVNGDVYEESHANWKRKLCEPTKSARLNAKRTKSSTASLSPKFESDTYNFDNSELSVNSSEIISGAAESSKPTGVGKSAISVGKTPSTMEELLECQWEMSSAYLHEQGQHFDIVSLLNCLQQIQTQNKNIDEQLKALTSRRDHLLTVNSRLQAPVGGSSSPSTSVPLAPSVVHLPAQSPADHSITASIQRSPQISPNKITRVVQVQYGTGSTPASVRGPSPLVNGGGAEPVLLKVGDYVAVAFSETWFPGLVKTLVGSDRALVLYMHREGKHYIWPQPEDQQPTDTRFIIATRISLHAVSSARAMYTIESSEIIDAKYQEYSKKYFSQTLG